MELHVGHIDIRSLNYVATEPPDATLPFPRNYEHLVMDAFHDIERKNVYIISREGS